MWSFRTLRGTPNMMITFQEDVIQCCASGINVSKNFWNLGATQTQRQDVQPNPAIIRWEQWEQSCLLTQDCGYQSHPLHPGLDSQVNPFSFGHYSCLKFPQNHPISLKGYESWKGSKKGGEGSKSPIKPTTENHVKLIPSTQSHTDRSRDTSDSLRCGKQYGRTITERPEAATTVNRQQKTI